MNWNFAFWACILHSKFVFLDFDVLFCPDIDAIDVYNVRFVCMGHGIALAAKSGRNAVLFTINIGPMWQTTYIRTPC